MGLDDTKGKLEIKNKYGIENQNDMTRTCNN